MSKWTEEEIDKMICKLPISVQENIQAMKECMDDGLILDSLIEQGKFVKVEIKHSIDKKNRRLNIEFKRIKNA